MAASAAFIPLPMEPDIRLEDYLDDKIQSTTDLENLDSLLASVEEQRSQLQSQLDDAARELEGARRAGADRHGTLQVRIEEFQALQHSIDVRQQIVASSDAPDEAIRRLELPMKQLHQVDLAHRYLLLLQDVEGLRATARSHLPQDPKLALEPYTRLMRLSAYLKELQGPADEAATHLIGYVANITDSLWDEMKRTMWDELDGVLQKRNWPKVDPHSEMDPEWLECFEKLVDLQVPEVLLADKVVPLLAIEVMAQIFIKEFAFHFLSDRATSNNQSIGTHCFPWFLNLIRHWEDFFKENTGHILAARFQYTRVSSMMVYLDPACALITALLPIMRKKVDLAVEEALANPTLLSSLMAQLMAFDEEIRTRFNYDGGDPEEGWGGLASEVLKKHFYTWLRAEKDFDLKRFQEIMTSEDSRKIDFEYSGLGKTKPTFGAVRTVDLLRSVTAQYEKVRSFSHKLRFLIDIQLTILDQFHDRLRGSLEAYYSITSTVGRTLHGVTKEELGALEGTGALESLCKVFGSCDHVVNALKDWSNEEFFVTFWEQLQTRAKRAESQGNLAGGMTYEEVKDRTSSNVGSEDDGGILFDETITAYSQRRKTAQEFLVSALVDSHHKAFRPYLHRTQWTTISEETTVVDPSQLSITAELDEPLSILKRNLDFLHRALGTAPFRRVWREALEKLQGTLWSDVLMRQSFTTLGATQFSRDLRAVTSLVDRYVPEGSNALASIRDGVRLLNLPVELEGEEGGGGGVTLKQASDRIFTDNAEAKKVLEELEIDTLTPANARQILQKRVENSE